MSISILQTAKNHTVYPEIPLVVTLPAAVTAGSYLAVIVFGQRTANPFNTLALGTTINNIAVAPAIKDDRSATLTDTFTLRDSIVNLSQELGSSPPIISPDASGYFPSVYTFLTSTAATAGVKNITITDPGNNVSLSPPIAYGRPVFDGGLYAVVIEIAGTSSGFDKAGHATGIVRNIGASIFTPTSNNSIVIESGIMMDSSSISPVSPAVLQHTNKFPAGSSQWVVVTTIQTSKLANGGFSNPIEYAAGVSALVVV